MDPSGRDFPLLVVLHACSLSTYEAARERLAQKGVVPSLLTLFTSDDVLVKTFCLAALQNISTEEKTRTYAPPRSPAQMGLRAVEGWLARCRPPLPSAAVCLSD